ncbi:FeoA family protein [Clostridium aminobutyricum]|uniref:Ferrous iron transport protein A n=1 Tax=Clostridium aminobutyricum TaxID=33953 RepID=A0A939D7N5_CLOAM|nr:FeoA family protein [Clostridium aminobutyricum]MBN7772597.1 ferrous iron transport protein A [Clostridium aminobutyricum]
MPLLLGEPGTVYTVRRVSGNEKDRHYLESLGFIVGAEVTIISKFSGYVLVNIKGARIGISGHMAKRIII